MGAVLAMRSAVAVLAVLMAAGCQTLLSGGAGPVGQGAVALPAEVLTGPALRVGIPSRGADAILTLSAVNADVETWVATDDITLSFRDGVLVASRGLGFDLMGADATGTLTALEGGGDEIYRRQMRYLTGDNRSAFLNAGCSMRDAGPEQIGGRMLRRFEEQCEARTNRFTNLFWRGPDGTILRSRQWVSPEIGFVTTARL